MGIIDRLARRRGYIKPEEAQRPPAIRGFSAAQQSNLVSKWTTAPKPIDADIRQGLRILVARSRDLAANDDYMRRFLLLLKSNVVGPEGCRLQARTIGFNGQPDIPANNAIEEHWRTWGELGSPEVTGGLSFHDCEKLFIETAAKDGEVLIRVVRGWHHNRYQFAFQFLDTQLLDVEYNRDLGGGSVIKMGVELDSWRRPVAYHLAQPKPLGDDYYSYGGQNYQRIPATDIMHRFLPEAVWQTRGFPWMAPSMFRLKMLGGYEEAELVAARVASSKMGFFQSEEGDDGYTGDTTDADGEGIIDAEPGTFSKLPPGVSFQAWNPDHPTGAFKDFVKANLRGIAAGLGVSYFSLANDLEGVNYSSGRLGAIEDQELWKQLQNWMISGFHKPLYDMWLQSALVTGQITINGKPLNSSRRDKYRRVAWQPRRWKWVDPAKEMKGHGEALDRRLKAPQQVITEMGNDPETVLDAWQAWDAMLSAKGITMPETTTPPQQPEIPDDAEDE